ncbi:hypothetical protein GO003_001620 [Methylicorpusculum oleiharenae]|uniref:hypothetical protein n=1 Tax=Methylicorpusculum oleiharenae TaxID=1338687 RepID=UPI001356BD33|nr:hypothetical protein [Methylicorpusculum oleiharenae]MCD2449094.1 hypothetical protein [Methylicorpusculum oleiharenae]
MSPATLEHALDLTEQMLMLALQQEWQQLNQLEALQRETIQSFFNQGAVLTQNDQSLIIKINSLLDQVIALSEDQMHSLNDQMTQMKKGRAAAKAYGQGEP